MTDDDDEDARRARADSLREEIEEALRRGPGGRPPRSPHEFVEREMRERDEAIEEEDDAESEPGEEDREGG